MMIVMPRMRCFGEQETNQLLAFKPPIKARRKCWDSGDWMLVHQQCKSPPHHAPGHAEPAAACCYQDHQQATVPRATAPVPASVIMPLVGPALPRAQDAVMRVRSWQPRPSRFQREASRCN